MGSHSGIAFTPPAEVRRIAAAPRHLHKVAIPVAGCASSILLDWVLNGTNIPHIRGAALALD